MEVERRQGELRRLILTRFNNSKRKTPPPRPMCLAEVFLLYRADEKHRSERSGVFQKKGKDKAIENRRRNQTIFSKP